MSRALLPLSQASTHAHVCWQGAEMSEEQYNAMTPEQQAAYWHQWQQYSQQYYGCSARPAAGPQSPVHSGLRRPRLSMASTR